jgi:transposase
LGHRPREREEGSEWDVHPRYSSEFRRDAVVLVRTAGQPVKKIAGDLGVCPETLRAWVKQDKTDRGEGAPGELTSAEKQERARRRRENADNGLTKAEILGGHGPRSRAAVRGGRQDGRRVAKPARWRNFSIRNEPSLLELLRPHLKRRQRLRLSAAELEKLHEVAQPFDPPAPHGA